MLIGQRVRLAFKAARYYSMSIDSAPDISHVDQLTVVVRYVKDDGPVERFLSFVNFVEHTGQGLPILLT